MPWAVILKVAAFVLVVGAVNYGFFLMPTPIRSGLIALIVFSAIGIVVYVSYASTPRDERTGRKMMPLRGKDIVGWITFATISHGLLLLFGDTSNIDLSYTGGVLVISGIIYAVLCFFCRREPDRDV